MDRFEVLVSDLCAEIDFLHGQIKTLTEQRDHYIGEFNEVCKSSGKHAEEMTGLLLKATLEGKFQ